MSYNNKILYNDKLNNCSIIEEHDGNTLFKLKTETGYYVQFNADHIVDYRYDWYCHVVGRQIREAVEHAIAKTKKDFQESIQKLIGIK